VAVELGGVEMDKFDGIDVDELEMEAGLEGLGVGVELEV
jgi:hypothetical protein